VFGVKVAIRGLVHGISLVKHFAGVPQDATRMEEVEDVRHEDHHGRVENVDEYLVRLYVAVAALGVLNDAEDGPDHDEDARSVEDPDEGLPGLGEPQADGRGLRVDAPVEYYNGDHKEGEEEDLDAKTPQDDVLSPLDLILRLCLG
jgi:hypothetical protein